MDEEATREGREDYEQATVHGRGIKHQWQIAQEENRWPTMLFFLVRGDNTFEMKARWFDENGNVTERPADLPAA